MTVRRIGVGRGARNDFVTEVLGIWLFRAVFLDGRAHLHVPGLETFFTPWHAALSSGLVATAAWTASVIWRNRRDERRIPTVPGARSGLIWG
jgi:hypothetical protein